jgi:SAM-dependent methyltransferase
MMPRMTEPTLYAEPVPVSGVGECRFYHSLDLPVSGTVHGDWDLRGRFDDYTGQLSLKGKSVLDLGTSSGFLSFEAEKRGARVVSFDQGDTNLRNSLPHLQAERQTNPARWLAQFDDILQRTRKAYWLAHREFRSQCKVHYGDVYQLPEGLGMFDVVLIGQILVHLRDSIGALESACARCTATLVIAEGMIDQDDRAYSHFLGRADRPDQDIAFWHHTTGFYIELLGMLGFRLNRKSLGRYNCRSDPNEPGMITTLVFERVHAPAR